MQYPLLRLLFDSGHNKRRHWSSKTDAVFAYLKPIALTQPTYRSQDKWSARDPGAPRTPMLSYSAT